ncbi:hypothetical protein ACFO3U_05990 [Flavobacterium ponti]|uniref:Glycosyltransferase family 1 protein n=1 Tax=Flavobacterium ponti TaxID=665133 RepID=A0ABV9P3P8_9FLAO
MSSLKVNIYTPQELNHSSYIQTGLFELEKDGFLSTKVRLSLSKKLGTIKVANSELLETSEPHPKTSFYELENTSTGKKIKFATDLYDASHSFSAYALEHCDFVFKRNFEKKNIQYLPQKYQDKLLPLGLTFGCHSPQKKQWYKFVIGYVLNVLLLNFKIDSYFFKRYQREFRTIKNHLKHIKTTRSITNFEVYKASNLSNEILFQTRCFSSEKSDDVKGIHLQRYKIIKLLRDKFPNEFKGGIIPSNISKTNYSDALTNLSSDPISYLNQVKKTKIVIYTRGLVNSPAWKMPEYLSQGKVIIAEKLTTELPIPLTHGKEVLFFEKEEEIPTIIQNTMYHNELCNSLAKNARSYFEQNVHPKENVKRMLTFMLQNTK